jgi:RHS repeat-associated protein
MTATTPITVAITPLANGGADRMSESILQIPVSRPPALENFSTLLAASRFLPETRVWGSTPEKQGFAGFWHCLSSTMQWGCGYSCDGTASGETDQRFYGSTYGRFNSPDPYMASGGPQSPASWNRYSYTRGDPVNRVDRRGLSDWEVTVVDQLCPPDSYDAECSGDNGGSGGTGNPGEGTPPAGSGSSAHDVVNAVQRDQLARSLTYLSGPCQNALKQDGIDLGKVASISADTNYWSVYVDPNETLAQITNSSAAGNTNTVQQVVSASVAVTVTYPGANGQTVTTNNVILGANYFYGVDALNQAGVSLAVQQNATLVHEALHTAGYGDDLQLAALLFPGMDFGKNQELASSVVGSYLRTCF